MFSIVGRDETFSVDKQGNIGRPDMRPPLAPSGGWKVLGLVRRCNFGVVEFIPFSEWEARLPTIDWTYKNGKPRYTLRDLDHGSVREWGEGVRCVYRGGAERVSDLLEAPDYRPLGDG